MFRSYPPQIVLEAVLNGLLTGAVYALVALGLTLVYGVLHIINFAHGAMLTLAMFAVLVVHLGLGLDPYLAILPLTPLFFGLGYALQRFVISPASRNDDGAILLVTLGLSIVQQIVQDHEGSVRVAATGPDGTAFEIVLPACDPPAASVSSP